VLRNLQCNRTGRLIELCVKKLNARENELNAEAVELAGRIAGNFEELGI
jgi:hypothetical protein